VPPSTTCAKIANFLLAREVAHRLMTIKGEDELAAIIKKSGRLSCPIVYVGEMLIGGARETIAAYESGKLLRLVER
jgi:glutaredoxin